MSKFPTELWVQMAKKDHPLKTRFRKFWPRTQNMVQKLLFVFGIQHSKSIIMHEFLILISQTLLYIFMQIDDFSILFLLSDAGL